MSSVQSTYAVVLAGGRGSRLQQLTDWRAKPAMPFAGSLKIIDFALSNCINSGIRRIGVLTQYKAQSLIRHITRHWGFLDARLGEFVDVVPAQQRMDEHWYTGTANAVWQNLDMLHEAQPSHVLILAGDHVYKMDYARMLDEHLRSDAAVSVSCIRIPLEQACAFGILNIDAGHQVVSFQEKPSRAQGLPDSPEQCLASMGIYLFNTETLVAELQRDARDPLSRHDFGHDILPRLVKQGQVRAHHFSSSAVPSNRPDPYWRDVGTLDAYWEAHMDLIRPLPDLDLYDPTWPIRGSNGSWPPAKFVADSQGRPGTATDSLISGGAIVSGATVQRCVLFPHVRVTDGAVVEDSLLLQGVQIGSGCVVRRAIIDKQCVLPAGTQVGVDLACDRQRFCVSPGGVTLVTASMLQSLVPQAAPLSPVRLSSEHPVAA